jgi:hypothetical protein
VSENLKSKETTIQICAGCGLQPIVVVDRYAQDPEDAHQCGWPMRVGPTRYYCSRDCFEDDHPRFRCDH